MFMKTTVKQQNRLRRRARIRSKISGTATCPRLTVFKSNRFIYAQLIDDVNGVTLASADSRSASDKDSAARAAMVGKSIAAAAKKAGIKKAVFDRGGFRYQGLIASLAEAARTAGLAF